MRQKDLDWNKKFLKDEWNYCIHLIQEKINELDNCTVEDGDELSQQHKFMKTTRNILGKGFEYYKINTNCVNERNLLEKSFSIIDDVVLMLEDK